MGTSGSGGIFHVIGAWLHSLTNTRVTFIHYKGSGPMYPDMIAGRLHAAVSIALVGLPYVKSGKLKAIANLGIDRAGAFPDLKTVAEQGVPEFEYPSWSGYLAPAKTPPAVVNRLSAAFAKVAKSPELMKKFESEYTVLVGSTPEAIVNRLSAEFSKVAKDPALIKRFEAEHTALIGSTPAEFRKTIEVEAVRWRKVVQENNIKLEE